MDSPSDHLRRLLRPFIELDEAHLELLAQMLEPFEARAGQVIYDHGVVCRDMIVLEEGLVRAYYMHEAREVNLRLICAPAVATAMSSLITGSPSQEWVEAITALRGYRADLARAEDVGLREVAVELRRLLAERHYLALERRLRMLQWKSGDERYAFFCEHMDPDIVHLTPGYHVASYLGVAPETLSRIRRRRARGGT